MRSQVINTGFCSLISSTPTPAGHFSQTKPFQLSQVSSGTPPQTPTASPSTTLSVSNSTSLQTSPEKRNKSEDNYYSSMTSFESQFSTQVGLCNAMPDPLQRATSPHSPTQSDQFAQTDEDDDHTPTQKDFMVYEARIKGKDVDLRQDKRTLPTGLSSPTGERPHSLPPSSPTVSDPMERRLSLYDNIDVYYNDTYEVDMEESLERLNTPTDQKPFTMGEHETLLYTPVAGNSPARSGTIGSPYKETSHSAQSSPAKYATYAGPSYAPVAAQAPPPPPRSLPVNELHQFDGDASPYRVRRVSPDRDAFRGVVYTTQAKVEGQSVRPKNLHSPVNGVPYFKTQTTYI